MGLLNDKTNVFFPRIYVDVHVFTKVALRVFDLFIGSSLFYYLSDLDCVKYNVSFFYYLIVLGCLF